MGNELHRYIKNFEDFRRVLKISIDNTKELLKIKYEQAVIITANREGLIDYFEDEKRKLINEISLNSNLIRVDINEFNVNEEDLSNLIGFVRNQFFIKQQNRYVISKENTKYLTKYFNDISNSIWISFYNTKVNDLKGNLSGVSENNFYPFKELKNYDVFCIYVADNIIEPYNDFSYLFQRLLYQDLIYPTTQKKFIEWLLNNDFINQKKYDFFMEKGQFYSLRKSTTSARENNFNNLFKL